MKKLKSIYALCGVAILGATGMLSAKNPVFDGWYADPEVAVYNNEYWIFPTISLPRDRQNSFDAFSSKDLVNWTKHENIIDTLEVSWAQKELWAPANVEKDGKYYLFFSANDVHEGEIGGIGVGVADTPGGPYKDYLGRPLINEIVNGAQPIDQFVFKDEDGRWYMIYGGWGHCNIVRLKDDFTGLLPFDDGEVYKEITPEHYTEGPVMFKKDGTYYFMWSEGVWNGPHYRVNYARSNSPFGPFKTEGTVLIQDGEHGTGPGHHSVLKVPNKNEYYIVYHRHPMGDDVDYHRVVCIDKMEFGKDGSIKPVKMTFDGPKKRVISK